MPLPIPLLPSGSSTIHVTTSTGATFFLPNTFNFVGVKQTKEITNQEVPLRNGSILTKPGRWEAQGFTLDGVLIERDTTLTRDSLTKHIINSPWKVRMSSRLGRYIEGYVEELTPTFGGNHETLRIRIGLFAITPFFYDSDASITSQVYDSAAATGGNEVIINSGDLTLRPIITITGGAGGITNPTITHNGSGRSITYTGLVGSGLSLVVDLANLTAKLDGSNTLNSMNGSMFYNPIELLQGSNSLVYTGSGIMTVAFNYRASYLMND